MLYPGTLYRYPLTRVTFFFVLEMWHFLPSCHVVILVLILIEEIPILVVHIDFVSWINRIAVTSCFYSSGVLST